MSDLPVQRREAPALSRFPTIEKDIRIRPRPLPAHVVLPPAEDVPKYRILYVAPAWRGCTSRQRAQALVDLGQSLTYLGYAGIKSRMGLPERLYRSLRRRVGYPLEWKRENGAICAAARHKAFDVLWIDKGLTIRPSTLRYVRRHTPHAKIVTYYSDDMGNPDNQSRYWLMSVPCYDLHVTTKSYNVSELRAMGAKDVLFVDKSYDPHTHRAIRLTDEDRARYGADVCFIGGYEEQRALSLLRLARAGIRLRVWGTRWHRLTEPSPPGLQLEHRPVYGNEYAKTICASKINLCFLRKANRDLQTARSIEIPACGGFMLAERTAEHLRLFKEGKEADYFDSQAELVDKIRYYLDRPQERRSIGDAGYQRCLRSGYSNHHRLLTVLRRIAGSC